LAAPPRSIAYEDRWLPVVRWHRRAGDVTWSFEAVAFPGPAHRDSGLVVSLLARAANGGASARAARLDPSPVLKRIARLSNPERNPAAPTPTRDALATFEDGAYFLTSILPQLR